MSSKSSAEMRRCGRCLPFERPDRYPCGFSGCKMPAMASPRHESESKQVFEAQLRATLDVIPNKRLADYLSLPKDHPLRFGIATGAAWDSHIALLHPDDQEESRKVWSTCVRTGCAGEFTFRVRNAEGVHRWFITRAEPLRASDGTRPMAPILTLTSDLWSTRGHRRNRWPDQGGKH